MQPTNLAEVSAQRTLSMLETALRAIVPLLNDAGVIEIMLNGDGRIWVERAGEGLARTDREMSAADAERAIRLLASHMDTTVGPASPSLAATLPRWGARFQGAVPPIVSRPVFTIRKPARRVYTLDDYVRDEVMSQAEADFLERAVLERKNIIVSGGTGSGKTTLTNALLRVVGRTRERVYLVEDNRELQCEAPNRIEVFTTADYPMRRAIVDALRHRPDRIIVGEVRDAAALEMLKAWGTGHPGGIATVHANSPASTPDRLCRLVEENNMVADKGFIADSVDLCVHISRAPDAPAGRQLSGICEVAVSEEHGHWALTPCSFGQS